MKLFVQIIQHVHLVLCANEFSVPFLVFEEQPLALLVSISITVPSFASLIEFPNYKSVILDSFFLNFAQHTRRGEGLCSTQEKRLRIACVWKGSEELMTVQFKSWTSLTKQLCQCEHMKHQDVSFLQQLFFSFSLSLSSLLFLSILSRSLPLSLTGTPQKKSSAKRKSVFRFRSYLPCKRENHLFWETLFHPAISPLLLQYHILPERKTTTITD